MRTLRTILIIRPFLAVAITMGRVGLACAELAPTECVILYNRDSDASTRIARHYAEARKIPPDRLFSLSLPLNETIPHAVYETDVAANLRSFLIDRPWGPMIRCIITTYDVSLRIGPIIPSKERLDRADTLEKALRDTMTRFAALVERIRTTDHLDVQPAPAAFNTAESLDRAALQAQYDRYIKELAELVSRHRDFAGEALLVGRRATFEIILQVEGQMGLLLRARGEEPQSPNSAIRVKRMREQIAEAESQLDTLMRYPSTSDEFDRAITIIRETRGLYGVAAAFQKRILSLRGVDSESSLDSELALIFWDDYDRSGWQTNPFHFDQFAGRRPSPSNQEVGVESQRRTLMVARLDGPAPETVLRMIDDAVRVERTGLKGTFYIDARSTRDAGLAAYDRDLIELARVVRTKTDIPVILDIQSDVFQPGQCPGAALYCGWYSLAHYVDAFEFVPGAVAAHIASFEMMSLRDGRKRYWCKEMLADGVAATFGATSEPFLHAFPMPSEFFSRLLSGRQTLVETYFQTLPLLSWRLALVGDPLYNPFRMNPQRITRGQD